MRLALILVSAVLAAPTTGYGQVPALVASTSSPLTATTLDGGQVALLLSGGSYARSSSDIRDAVTVSGIAGVTIDRVSRLGDTAVTAVLGFSGHLGTDGTLTFTVEAQAIADYNGPALTAEIPVTAASAVSVTASTPFGLWESSLNGTVVTLTLAGGSYERADIRTFVAVSGLAGVTVDGQTGIRRASATEVTVELTYLGDFVAPMATDGTLTFTVHAQAIADYNGPALTAELPVMAGLGPFSHDPARDFNTLDARNVWPHGLWSDGTTMWVVDRWVPPKIYAYDLATRARDPGMDFNTLSAAGNEGPRGLWSDGTTMWVAEWEGDAPHDDGKIYAYDMTTRARDSTEDFDIANVTNDRQNLSGLWSDGTTMWVAVRFYRSAKIRAYDLATKARDPARDLNTLNAAGNTAPMGLWSDGATLWVTDYVDEKIYAYDLTTKARDPGKDFNTLKAAGIEPTGLWSDGTTLWVADADDAKLYAYLLSPSPPKPANYPDLTVQSRSVSDSRPTAGDSLTLSATVHNQGSGQSPATTLRFYRSTDATISTSDTEVGSQAVGGLAASGTSTHSTDLTAPSSAGTYYYGVCVESVSGESNTGNNCSTAVTVTVGAAPAPDLVVQTPSVSNSSPTAGDSFTLSAAVHNQGSGQSPATTLRFYRSTDGTISTSDTEVGSQAVGGLAASGTSFYSTDLTAPSSADTWYYGACVESVSGETDTGNNCSSAVAVAVAPEPPAAAGADFNGDGTVDFADFFEFVDAFGGSDLAFDLNGDGTVDFADFFEFVDAWGEPAQAKLVALAQEMIGLPAGPQLQQNVPNPFNSETVVSWFLLEPGPARVEVFALTGQRVAVLHEGPQRAGYHRIRWDGRDEAGRALASGVYLCRLVGGGGVQARKLTLLR